MIKQLQVMFITADVLLGAHALLAQGMLHTSHDGLWRRFLRLAHPCTCRGLYLPEDSPYFINTSFLTCVNWPASSR